MSLIRSNASSRKRFILSPEILEDRDVPAGNVFASVSGGVLKVTGDGVDNKIWIMGLGNGAAIVAPLDTTTINGFHGPQILGGIAFAYSVQLGGGNDYLKLTNTSGFLSTYVDMGDGNDGLGFDFAKHVGTTVISMGAGNDILSMGMGKLLGGTIINFGPGDNRANIAATEFGSVSLQGGSGQDSLGLLAVNFHSIPATAGIERSYSTLMPYANSETATVRSGQAVTVNVAANDVAPGDRVNGSSIRITKMPVNGTVTVNGDGTVTYRAGNTTATSDSFHYTIRNSSGAESNEAALILTLRPNSLPNVDPPNPVITTNTGSVTNATEINYTVTFDENVTGFAQSDLTVSGGTVSNFTAVNGKTYTFKLTPAGDGLVTVTIPAGAAKDSDNNNSTSTSKTITSDRTAPTATITTTSSTANPAQVPVTVTFNEDVTQFVVGDVIVTGGTVSGFTPVSSKIYTFIVTPDASGNMITVNIAASVANDSAGNGNVAAPTFTTIPDRTNAGMTSTRPDSSDANWTTTPSGLKIWDIQTGTGPAVVSSSKLGVFYMGWLTDASATVFDSSTTAGAPALFPLSNLIQGWKEGLLGMQPGGIRRLYIPAALAYGSAGQGSVPPNADLIFEIKLISVA